MANRQRIALALALMDIRNEHADATERLISKLAAMAKLNEPMEKSVYDRGNAILDGIEISAAKKKRRHK
ncbi:MAG: hypothetical protein HC888_00335 [Candidatus Competibacteraceae bacterium]|nr:hypothetical protein [Candidatus Competibacteraceae bacterium]